MVLSEDILGGGGGTEERFGEESYGGEVREKDSAVIRKSGGGEGGEGRFLGPSRKAIKKGRHIMHVRATRKGIQYFRVLTRSQNP